MYIFNEYRRILVFLKWIKVVFVIVIYLGGILFFCCFIFIIYVVNKYY